MEINAINPGIKHVHRGFEIAYDRDGYVVYQGSTVIHRSRDVGRVDAETNRQRAILWVDNNSVDSDKNVAKPLA